MNKFGRMVINGGGITVREKQSSNKIHSNVQLVVKWTQQTRSRLMRQLLAKTWGAMIPALWMKSAIESGVIILLWGGFLLKNLEPVRVWHRYHCQIIIWNRLRAMALWVPGGCSLAREVEEVGFRHCSETSGVRERKRQEWWYGLLGSRSGNKAKGTLNIT